MWFFRCKLYLLSGRVEWLQNGAHSFEAALIHLHVFPGGEVSVIPLHRFIPTTVSCTMSALVTPLEDTTYSVKCTARSILRFTANEIFHLSLVLPPVRLYEAAPQCAIDQVLHSIPAGGLDQTCPTVIVSFNQPVCVLTQSQMVWINTSGLLSQNINQWYWDTAAMISTISCM